MTSVFNVRKVVSGRYVEVSRFASPVARGFTKSATSARLNPPVSRRADNIARAKKRIFRLVHANELRFRPIFLTLTYAENMLDRSRAIKDLSVFFRALRRHYPNIKYLYVLETQKRGAYHAHILLFNIPWLPISLLCRLWVHGSNDIKFTNDTQHVAFYLAKYVGKDLHSSPSFTRSFNSSQGLMRPETFYYLVSSYFPTQRGELRSEHIRSNIVGNIILTRATYDDT